MNQILIDKHLHCSRAYKNELHKLCEPLFKNSLIKYFSYNRYYRDQKWTGLYTDPTPVDGSLKADRGPLFLDKHGINIKNGFYVHGDLRALLTLKVDANYVEKFFDQENNPIGKEVVQNGLLIVRKGRSYDESFYFSMLLTSDVIDRNYYYANLQTIKKFCLYFLYNGKRLIAACEKYKIPYDIPPNQQTNFDAFFSAVDVAEQQDCINVNKFNFSTSFGEVFLSRQEYNCLRLIARGFSYTDIGVELGLQYKTVESYVQNLKNKLNVETKPELAAYYNECSLVDFFDVKDAF